MSTSRADSKIQSTPSKNKTAARTRSTSQMPSNKVKEIYDDVSYDVSNATKVSFDSFLRLFLSRCLVGEEKTRYETLQKRIEELQVERYNNVASKRSQQDSLEDDPAEPNAEDDEPEAPTEEETKLEKERDDFMNDILQQCLEKVDSVANNADVRSRLYKFGQLVELKSAETDRYKPYADLYNKALDELATLSGLPLRPEPAHRLRLCRADPRAIKSNFPGTGENLERKPDLVRTSRHAAEKTHKPGDQYFGDKPSKAFEWSQVLSCEEMKAFKGGLTTGAEVVLNGKVFDSTSGTAEDRMLREIPWDKDYNFSAPETPQIISTTISSTKSGSKRGRSELADDATSSNKKARLEAAVGSSTRTNQALAAKDRDTNKNTDARVQVSTYAMELMSYGPGVDQVIMTLVVDEIIYLWHYDRQGIHRSDGISIITDLPRFLVLLLAFQRFTVEDWGIVPVLNPAALIHLGIEQHPDSNVRDEPCPPVTEIRLPLAGDHFAGPPRIILDMDPRVESLTIKVNEYLSHKPHCISGRATSVFKAAYNGKAVAIKISSPEVQRPHEGDTLAVARAIATAKDRSILEHLPVFYLSGDFKAGCTLRVRSMFGTCAKGFRALRAVVLEELAKLTSQVGESFVNAWLHGVTCHAFLWKHGVEHSDPSLWNVMYHPIRKCGVLTDFDLSIIAWRERVLGTDRTGTIPFMALELLREPYWQGKIIRRYHHELEAFIWMLPFVFLAYDTGKLDPNNRFIKYWITSDYVNCAKSKLNFINSADLDDSVPLVASAFQKYNMLMLDACNMVKDQHHVRRNEASKATFARQRAHPKRDRISEPASHVEQSARMWDEFISILPGFGIDTARLEKHRPIFNREECQDLFDEMKVIYNSLGFTA